MADTTIFEQRWLPRVTLTIDGSSYSCVVDGITGLAPQRTATSEEIGLGISSLDPPTITAPSARDLVDRAALAVSNAVRSSVGQRLGIGEILWVRLRTIWAVKAALRALDVEI